MRTDLVGGHSTNDGKLFWSSVAEFRNTLTLDKLDSNKYRRPYMLYARQDAFVTMQNRLIVICTEEISLTV